MGKLHGKVAVITGGTEGIGLATAQLFVHEGAYVFITGRRQKELDQAVTAIGSNDRRPDVANADLDRLYGLSRNGKTPVLLGSRGFGRRTSQAPRPCRRAVANVH